MGRAHQHLGTEGSLPGVKGSPSFYPGQTCPGTHREFLHGVPCESPGGHQVSALPQGGADTSDLSGSTSGVTQGSLHCRRCELGSRPYVQDGSSPVRVEASPRDGGSPVGMDRH